MSLKKLNNAGVSNLLEDAATLLRNRGLAKGVRINPEDGSVDLIAALAIAAGATERDLMSSMAISDFQLIPVNEARFMASYDVLDAMLFQDPEEWADKQDVTVKEVAALMSMAAWKLRIAIT
jgi:hypothetical protein